MKLDIFGQFEDRLLIHQYYLLLADDRIYIPKYSEAFPITVSADSPILNILTNLQSGLSDIFRNPVDCIVVLIKFSLWPQDIL